MEITGAYIRKDGAPLFSKTFDYAFKFVNGLARVRVDGLWGYINAKGEWVIKPQYNNAKDFRKVSD